MSFGSPYLLLSLLLVPVALIGYARLERRRSARVVSWSTRALLPNMVGQRARRMRHLPAALILVGLVFLLVGFARPQRSSTVSRGGAPTIALAFDVSGSMAARDIGPSRVLAARNLALQFLRELPASFRVAVITFGNLVHLVVAPTYQRATVVANLPQAITPLAGTRIGDGIDDALSSVIETGGKGYPGDPYRPGAVLVLSDGGQTAGGPTPQEAANTAYIDGVPVDAVAIGSAHGTVTQPVTVDRITVPTVIRVPVYPSALIAAAHLTGGHFAALSAVSQESKVVQTLRSVYAGLSSTLTPTRSVHAYSAATVEVALACILAGIVIAAVLFGTLT